MNRRDMLKGLGLAAVMPALGPTGIAALTGAVVATPKPTKPALIYGGENGPELVKPITNNITITTGADPSQIIQVIKQHTRSANGFT